MEFLTEETPGKIMALVGTALFSMAMLFSVTVSEASFSGSQAYVPDVFGPQNVVAVLDSASASYSKFLTANLFQPAQESYAMAADIISYVGDNASTEIVRVAGLDGMLTKQVDYGVGQAKVAGAYIQALR